MGKGKKKAKRKIESKKTHVHKPAAKTWLKYLLFIGLLACVLFLASKMFSGASSATSNDDLVSSYYKPMPLQLSETVTVKPEFKMLADLYNAKNYKDVIPYLNGLILKKPDAKWNLYRGIAHYEMGNLSEAEEDFKILANSPNIYLAEHGQWYQALTSLKIGDVESAKPILQALSVKTQSNYTKQSKELLSKL